MRFCKQGERPRRALSVYLVTLYHRGRIDLRMGRRNKSVNAEVKCGREYMYLSGRDGAVRDGADPWKRQRKERTNHSAYDLPSVDVHGILSASKWRSGCDVWIGTPSSTTGTPRSRATRSEQSRRLFLIDGTPQKRSPTSSCTTSRRSWPRRGGRSSRTRSCVENYELAS